MDTALESADQEVRAPVGLFGTRACCPTAGRVCCRGRCTWARCRARQRLFDFNRTRPPPGQIDSDRLRDARDPTQHAAGGHHGRPGPDRRGPWRTSWASTQPSHVLARALPAAAPPAVAAPGWRAGSSGPDAIGLARGEGAAENLKNAERTPAYRRRRARAGAAVRRTRPSRGVSPAWCACWRSGDRRLRRPDLTRTRRARSSSRVPLIFPTFAPPEGSAGRRLRRGAGFGWIRRRPGGAGFLTDTQEDIGMTNDQRRPRVPARRRKPSRRAAPGGRRRPRTAVAGCRAAAGAGQPVPGPPAPSSPLTASLRADFAFETRCRDGRAVGASVSQWTEQAIVGNLGLQRGHGPRLVLQPRRHRSG
jgi:hypothetical protein